MLIYHKNFMANSKNKASKPPLQLQDYQRIFRTIHGILLNEKCDPAKACVYFGIFGAAILQKHHRITADIRIGAAGYRIGPAGHEVMLFANLQPTGFQSDPDGFHCWLEVEGWAIDFQAPLFPDLMGVPSMPRKMFQKPLSYMNPELDVPDAFWYERNPELELHCLQSHFDKRANHDLGEICLTWYKPLPRKMLASIGIGNQYGDVNQVSLSPCLLSGVW